MHKYMLTRVSAESAADDADEADAVARCAAEVLGEREPAVRGADLTGTGLLAQLKPALIDHPQAACPDRVPEALQAAVGVHRQGTVPVVDPREHVSPGVAAPGEAEVFHQDDLGRGEAVVHFRQGELPARAGDPGLRVRLPRA